MLNGIRTGTVGLLLALTVVLLSACHTVEGAGQDVSATGRAVTSGAAAAAPR